MVSIPINSKRYIAIFIALLLWSSVIQANDDAYIKLQIDGSEVFFGDTIVLNVESTGLLDPIDFSPLLEQATLLRETSGTRISVINGKIVEIKLEWMDLQPKAPGVLVIGPLQAGDVSSNSVHVKVLDLVRPDWQPETDDLQIKTTLTPASALVNQQVVLSIELLHRYPISSESVSLPALNDFSHRNIISERRTFKDEDKEWSRTEWRYLLYPRESGTLDIGGIEWSGTTLKSRAERAQFSRTVESLKLSVAEAADTQSSWWLPSDGVTLSEAWSQPPTTLRAGDELERTITVEAAAVLAGQIPTPVVTESRAIQQTLIDTKREEKITGNSVISTGVFTYRVKAQSPIPVFLDTVRIPWWDTGANEAREAIIPARRINVGLPDRADLLSKVALQETGISGFKHQLQSTDWLRFSLYSLAVVAAVLSLYRLFPAARARYRKKQQLKKYFSRLKNAARKNDEPEVYRLLRLPGSEQLLAGHGRELERTLESRLYSTRATPEPKFNLMAMIRTTEKNAKHAAGKTTQTNNSALAEI